MSEKGAFLVTGAAGCIGSWVLYHLIKNGNKAVSLDLGNDRHRLDLLLSREEQHAITFELGDLRDGGRLNEVVEAHGINRIIHLAALQVPFCKADPVLGAEVNVVGTVNVFEAARKNNIPHIAYASSVAVYGPPELYGEIIQDDDARVPHTLYGVYKVANEGTAQIYWNDHQISSAALRPYTVYGVGRDQGMTSEPTKAMLAVANGASFEIAFSGRMQFQLASDIARYFIAAADTPLPGAAVFNIGTPTHSVEDVVTCIKDIRPNAQISFKKNDLPFPAGLDGASLNAYLPHIKETPLKEGIKQTIEHFEKI